MLKDAYTIPPIMIAAKIASSPYSEFDLTFSRLTELQRATLVSKIIPVVTPRPTRDEIRHLDSARSTSRLRRVGPGPFMIFLVFV